jgi:hypothetical protein
MRIWLKIVLPIAFAAAAWSAPVCTMGTYASYQALSSTGCTIGDETFSNFGGLTFTNSLGVDEISTSELFITPTVIGSGPGSVDQLLFNYQGLPTGAGGFPSSTDIGVLSNQDLSYEFQYLVAPTSSPIPIVDIQMASTILNTNGGSVSAVKDVDTNATQSSANDGGAQHPSFTPVIGPLTAVSFGGPYTVQDTISLEGQNGVAEQQDFTNGFTEGTATVSSAPEPSTNLLIGTGLILFGLTRKFRANR